VPVGTSVPLWALLDVTVRYFLFFSRHEPTAHTSWGILGTSHRRVPSVVGVPFSVFLSAASHQCVLVYPEKTAGDFITASSTPAATSTSARNGATTSTSVTGIISAPSQSAVLLIGTPFAGPPISSTHPPTSTSTSSPSPTPSRDRTSDTGAIVGGVVGGIALIGIVIVSIVYIRRQRNDSPYATSSAYIAPSTLFVADVSQQSPTVQVSQQSPIVQVPPQSPTEHVSLKSPTEHVSLQSPTEHEGKKALSDDGTLVSSDMPESPVISPMVYVRVFVPVALILVRDIFPPVLPRTRIWQPRFQSPKTIHMPRTSLTQQFLDSTKDPEITPFKPRDHSTTACPHSDFHPSRFTPGSGRAPVCRSKPSLFGLSRRHTNKGHRFGLMY